MKRTWLVSLFSLAMLSLHAAPIPNALAVSAILGEGANQNYQAMLGIACAIRNRGSLQGVYGARNLIAQNAPARIRARAKRAWTESANIDITHGCRFFGCPADAGYFLHTLHFHAVLKIDHITFYKP